MRPWVADVFPPAYEWKSRVFARQLARDDLAVPGRLRSLPAEARLAALARDDAQMRAMFVAAPPEFEVVRSRLAEAERM
ncbi:MAG: hypothetical protein Q8R98_00570, partial [Rubrivivax sp.]|nr:hypothetical protein [Rubrivivax sp.]